MSTIKTDAITAVSTNTDISVDGDGTGVPDLGAGMKVGGSVGIPVSELRTGTDGELITWDASGNPTTVAVGTSTHVLTSNGVGAAPTFQAPAGGGASFTYSGVTTIASGGTAYTSIPSGTTRIYISVHSVHPSDSSTVWGVQLGDAGGLETSGYLSGVVTHEPGQTTVGGGSNTMLAIGIARVAGNHPHSGLTSILLVDSTTNRWSSHSVMGESVSLHGGGSKALSAELTQIKILPTSGTFSSGNICIAYQ